MRFLFFVSFLLLIGLRLHAGKSDACLDIYWSDSGGGGSTLIVSPAGESILIDSGNPGGRDSSRILNLITNTAGLDHLDHLIVTHFHIDHFGGAAEIAKAIPVRNVWDNGLPETDPDGNVGSGWALTSRAYRNLSAGTRHRVDPGTVLPLRIRGRSLSLRCLMVRQTPISNSAKGRRTKPVVTAPRLKERDSSDNANSSTWLLSFGDFQFFDAGDLTWNIETKLIWPRILVPEIDLYQVTHHGLDASNHPQLIAALNPRVTVMNNGPTKGTSGEVMSTLRNLPNLEAQFQLHRNTRSDGSTNNTAADFIANPAGSEGQFIHCSVATDSLSYTLNLPAIKTSRTYITRK